MEELNLLSNEGLTPVKVNDHFNYKNEQGNLISNENFLFARRFISGRAVVQRENGLWNYLKSNGTFLCPERDFEAIDDFIGPFGYVLVDEKWLRIDSEGKLIV